MLGHESFRLVDARHAESSLHLVDHGKLIAEMNVTQLSVNEKNDNERMRHTWHGAVPCWEKCKRVIAVCERMHNASTQRHALSRQED